MGLRLSAVNEDAVSLNRAPARVTGAGPEVSSVVRVLPDDPSSSRLQIVERGGSAWAVAWPGVNSHLRSMHRISLSGGGMTLKMRHPMEAVYYVISGDLAVEDDQSGSSQRLVAGSMAFVEAQTRYRFVAGDRGSELVGGPCPPDPGVYRHLLED